MSKKKSQQQNGHHLSEDDIRFVFFGLKTGKLNNFDGGQRLMVMEAMLVAFPYLKVYMKSDGKDGKHGDLLEEQFLRKHKMIRMGLWILIVFFSAVVLVGIYSIIR